MFTKNNIKFALVNTITVVLIIYIISIPNVAAGIMYEDDGMIGLLSGLCFIFFSVFVFSLRFLHINPYEKASQAQSYEKVKLDHLSECLTACGDYISSEKKGYFLPYVVHVRDQVIKLMRKDELIRKLVIEKFSDEGITSINYYETLDKLINIFISNVEEILNKLRVFDELNAATPLRKGLSKGNADYSRDGLFDNYLDSITKTVNNNEEILLKLDELAVELVNVNSSSESEVREAMEESGVENLIQNTKKYL